jgi:predicted nucleotidyltransferase
MSVGPEELAAAMVRRGARARRWWDERARQLTERVEAEIATALADGLGRRAWLIGSLASGTFGPASDVDIVVEGLPATRTGELWDRLGVRLGARIDLLRLEELAPRFRSRVLSEGRCYHAP